MEEVRTSAGVAAKLADMVRTRSTKAIAGQTGVVGIVHGRGQGNRRIGLRADMDALPIHEATGLPHASTQAGKMHACGHDGHTTMLLGAAQYLARTRNFDGTAVLIFQPAEEGLGGARAMIADGLFQRFPVDEVYGMHNQPTGFAGPRDAVQGAGHGGGVLLRHHRDGQGQPCRHAAAVARRAGRGIGAGRAVPDDPGPQRRAAGSGRSRRRVQIHAGSAYNVVPETATLAGTIRFFRPEVRDLMQARMSAICDGAAQAFDLQITCDFREIPGRAGERDADCRTPDEAAADVLGAAMRDDSQPFTGSEDFADMRAAGPAPATWAMWNGAAAQSGFVLTRASCPSARRSCAAERRLPVAA